MVFIQYFSNLVFVAFTNPKSGMVNLVVEYMDGGSLQDLVMHGGCADEEVLADIAYQVLSGLSFLHSNNKMHRDIKPGTFKHIPICLISQEIFYYLVEVL